MSYSYSSAYPRVPNSTPQIPTSVRPPIHNPYDKFTQPQFDQWIGGITSALRKALGQEEEEILTSQSAEPPEEDTHLVSDTEEYDVEDSFAEWKAMRAKEKGKMRAMEDEQGSEDGGSQETYEKSGVRDLTTGNTPDDAIELLSDGDDAEGEDPNDHEEYSGEDHGGGLIRGFSPVESDGEMENRYVGSSKHVVSSRTCEDPANPARQQAIEISDGEPENNDQAADSFETENELFGWGQCAEGERQQPPDIRDPWELPKTYAEDLYTGGPVRDMDRARLSPSHLTTPAEDTADFENIDPQLRPSATTVSRSAVHELAEVSQAPLISTLITLAVDQVSNSDEEVSLYDEDVPELDTPTNEALRHESDFVSFMALNQPSDAESEPDRPEIFYISDNDGGEVSEGDGEAEEDDFNDGLVPLGTSDLEIPAEHGPEDGGEELDELEDDDEPVVQVTTSTPYGYYGLDASSVAGSGGLDDETRTVGLPSDAPKGDRSSGPDMTVSQESTLLDPHGLASLPAAATLVDIDHQLQPELPVAVDEATKVSVAEAEASFTSLEGTPSISEVVVGIEDVGDAGEDSVADDTVLVDGAVLTANEVEEVLKDAFAETDQTVLTRNVREGATPTPDTTLFVEEKVTRTSPIPGPTVAPPDVSAGEGLFPNDTAIKSEENISSSPPLTLKDELSISQGAQKNPLPFVMPLVANPNVRDPMSAPWSPVQSEPSTPVASLLYLPAVTKFKRENQLPGVVHSSSGLFTPLEGSGSSSPSPSDTATPEDRPEGQVEAEALSADDDGQRREEPATCVVVRNLPDIQGAEPEATPVSPHDGDWEEIPRLPELPAETVDHVVATPPAATRVFFQPVEFNDDAEDIGARSETDPDNGAQDVDTPRAVVADSHHEEGLAQDVQRQDNPEPSVHPSDTRNDPPKVIETENPFKLVENNCVAAPGTVTNDNDVPSVSPPSPDEEKTPRWDVSEIPAAVAEDSSTTGPIQSEIQSPSPLLSRTQESPDAPEKSQRSMRKRKRSASDSTKPEAPVSGCAANGKVSNAASTLLKDEEHEEVNRELVDEESRNKEREHDSDKESLASSLVAPRNADLSSQDGSRASSVVSEQPLLPWDRTPVPEDAPVFHGHGKFKAALQVFKLRKTSENRTQEQGRSNEKGQEKENPDVAKAGPRKPSENGPKESKQAKTLPSLVLPVVPTQPSLPSTSTSQSPMTPASVLPPASPTVVAAPAENATPPREEIAKETTEHDRGPTKKPTAKTVKRIASKKRAFFEPKSTRSQCRYHKISIPIEEDGPRVTFCVPQCSLNDKKLMEEEDITDDGLATVRDFERLWDHVEEQNLDSSVIGAIKQLVGLDLLRENEVYYLPTDEEMRQMERRRGREERKKNRKSIGGTANAENASNAGRPSSVSAASPTPQLFLSQVEKWKTGPPPSFAESVSTASTRSKADKGDLAQSISGDETTDGERGGRTKRRRTGKERDGGSLRNTPSIREDSAAPSTAGSPAPSQSMSERTSVRRSRRTLKKGTSADAQAYRPPLSSGDSSEDELENTKARRKTARVGTKGLKRRRTEGTGDSLAPSVGSGSVGDHDAPLSPRSTRSKRAKIDEK